MDTKICEYEKCAKPHTRNGLYCSEPCRKLAWEASHTRAPRQRSEGVKQRPASADWPARRAAIVAKYAPAPRAVPGQAER